MGRRGILFVIIAVGAGLAAWKAIPARGWSDPTKPARLGDLVKPGAASGYNLLLVTLDTTRADYLGCYGRREAATPAIDSLLKHGVRFDHAITPVPLTLPSHCSIMTGLGPRQHGVHNNGTYHLPEEHTTLAERLKTRGYDSAAFVAAFVLDKRFGIAQGFDTYDFKVSDQGRRGGDSMENERPANDVTNSALQWLKARKDNPEKPFFMWVHYFDPHHPYQSPLQSSPRFAGKPYDAEIAFTDVHFKRLLDALDAQGLRQRTLVVLVSDHGESLGEHGEPQHGVFIYDCTVRVAFVISSPSLFQAAHRVDDQLVSTTDLLPTLEDLLGLPASPGLDGQSLLTADADPQRAIYIETVYPKEQFTCTPLHGLRRRTDKFILAPNPEYYDLTKDPKEIKNLYDTGPAGLSALQEQLSRMLALAPEAAASAKRTMSVEEETRLSALGYGGDIDATTSGVPCDPKDKLAQLTPVWDATELAQQGKLDQAEALLKEVISQNRGYATPVHTLADLYARQDRHGDAVELLEAFPRSPPNADILVHLAENLLALGRFAEMEEKLEAAALIDPQRGSIPKLRGDRWFQAEQYDKAIEEYEKALSLDPERLGPDVRDKLKKAKDALRGGTP